jgi:serine/threonine protein kinase
MVAVGDVISSYTLERELGGTMSKVFAVKGDSAVLKLNKYTPYRIEKECDELFRNEIRVTKELNSYPCFPNFIENGRYGTLDYMVMENIAGLNLGEFYKNERKDIDHDEFLRNAMTTLRNTAIALDVMHTLGIIHGDIKPKNVFYIPGSYDIVLYDFGSSNYGIQEEKDDKTLLRYNIEKIRVTPFFVSPEQLEVYFYSSSADIFSFGIAASLVLANVHPRLEINKKNKYTFTEVLNFMRSFKITHRLTDHGVPKKLAEVVEACLDKEKNRPTSIELVDDLNDLLEAV